MVSNRSNFSVDPLSDVLALLKLQGYAAGGFDASGEWAVQFGSHPGFKFHAVLAGEFWVVVEGAPHPVKVKAGESFLLARGLPFLFATDLSVEPIAFETLLPQVFDGRIITYNQGGEVLSIGAFFSVAEPQADLLVSMLPPLIHIREELDRETLRWCVERMRQELLDSQPGSFIVAQQLATMMLVQVLRLHLADSRRDEAGWLFALADRRLRAAINAMHEQPGRRWTLQAMAEQAAMSRTTFALKFKATAGVSPLDYLTRWRMMLAAERLTSSSASVSEIGFALGYQSEKSFSTAFKRIMNCSPRRYGRQRRHYIAIGDD
jgi:AraC-like DNA-binding protein